MGKNNKKTRLGKKLASPQQQVPNSVKERQLRALRLTQMSARITSGPIPDADEMERYRQVQPDLPDRIMRQFERRSEMAEAQGEHRMQLERTVVRNNIIMERLGWFSATLLGIVTILGSFWIISIGKSLTGLAGVIAALVALLGLYVFARRDQIQTLGKKRAAEMLKRGATPEQLDLLPDAQEAE